MVRRTGVDSEWAQRIETDLRRIRARLQSVADGSRDGSGARAEVPEKQSG